MCGDVGFSFFRYQLHIFQMQRFYGLVETMNEDIERLVKENNKFTLRRMKYEKAFYILHRAYKTKQTNKEGE
jgi:hypothetical protein